MSIPVPISEFLSKYDQTVSNHAILMREVLLENLPGIIEQVDLPAKMIAYCYGQKYVDVICVIFPSKKALKLSFNRGTRLEDPDKLLEGEAKITRYVQLKTAEQIQSPSLKKLIEHALYLYKNQSDK